jgi:hypothetical protein
MRGLRRPLWVTLAALAGRLASPALHFDLGPAVGSQVEYELEGFVVMRCDG